MFLVLFALSIGSWLCSATIAPSSASASANYLVNFCHNAPGSNNGIDIGDPGPGFKIDNTCGDLSAGAAIVQSAAGSVQGRQSWSVTAPKTTKFTALALVLEYSVPSLQQMRWEIAGVDGGGMLEAFNLNAPPRSGPRVYTMAGASSIEGRLLCNSISGACSLSSPAKIFLSEMTASLRDPAPPTVSFDESLESGGPLNGTATLPYRADDSGSGVRATALIVDGVRQPTVIDTNTGDCVEPFRKLRPCKLHLISSFTLDTTALADGLHEIQVAALDASNQEGVSSVKQVRIHNRPLNTAPPAISGPAAVGGVLQASPGTWAGDPTAFAFEWVRCPATVQTLDELACSGIPGATGPHYVPAPQDAGQRVAAIVSATNPFGTEFAVSGLSPVIAAAGTPADGTAPLLTEVSLSRSRFRVGKARSVLRFASSEAGTLSLTIRKLGPRKGAPRQVASLSRAIGAGRGRVTLSGRIKGKPMAPGRYRLLVGVSDAAGNASSPSSIGFRVLPG